MEAATVPCPVAACSRANFRRRAAQGLAVPQPRFPAAAEPLPGRGAAPGEPGGQSCRHRTRRQPSAHSAAAHPDRSKLSLARHVPPRYADRYEGAEAAAPRSLAHGTGEPRCRPPRPSPAVPGRRPYLDGPGGLALDVVGHRRRLVHGAGGVTDCGAGRARGARGSPRLRAAGGAPAAAAPHPGAPRQLRPLRPAPPRPAPPRGTGTGPGMSRSRSRDGA